MIYKYLKDSKSSQKITLYKQKFTEILYNIIQSNVLLFIINYKALNENSFYVICIFRKNNGTPARYICKQVNQLFFTQFIEVVTPYATTPHSPFDQNRHPICIDF